MVRSDALENRARIVAAARVALAEDAAASMNQIAQSAGVGAGTLYRHYPTRESLILDVYQQELTRLVASASRLLETLPAIDALRRWTVELVRSMRKKHGLGDALSPKAYQTIAASSYEPVIGAITALLRAGQREGSIRADADPGDFLQLTGALWRAASGPNDRSGPMLDLILDGLRAQRDS